jgi:hypothetical protein
MGPYPCDKSFFKYCKGAVANSNTGSTIYVGAPIGAVAGLAVQLNGKVPPTQRVKLELRKPEGEFHKKGELAPGQLPRSCVQLFPLVCARFANH